MMFSLIFRRGGGEAACFPALPQCDLASGHILRYNGRMKCTPPLTATLLLALLACCGSEENKDPETAAEKLAEAQRLLKPHVEGEESDFAAANRLTHEAAEQGDMQAQIVLGGLYLYGGKGVEPNPRESLRWFEKAAAQGSIESHIFIGDIYFYGLGVPRDAEAALRHWKTAADGGFAEAQYRLGNTLLARGEQMQQGIELLTQAATSPRPSSSSAAAACVLANAYAKGRGVPQDAAKAIEWYALAASGGNPRAQQIYALMLLSGDGVPQDVAKGEALLRLAAGQGHTSAMAQLVNWLRNKENASEAEKKEAEAWAEQLDAQLARQKERRQPAAEP